MKRLGFAGITALGLLLSGCSTLGDYDSNNMMVIRDGHSEASPHAHSSMLFRKAMPRRGSSGQDFFWFPRCEPTGEKTYYSKTAYECEFN